MENNYLLWLKLETGGFANDDLPEGKGSKIYPVLEVVAVLTDAMYLDEVDSFRSAIYGNLSTCSDFASKLHKETGLISEVIKSGIELLDAETKLIEMLISHGVEPYSRSANSVAFLAGQNINSHELLFIRDQMPRLSKFLHYSTFDLIGFCMADAMWNPVSAQDRNDQIDWYDDSPRAKVTRMISSAKHFKNKF